MGNLQQVTTSKPLSSAPTQRRVLFSAVRYLGGKALTILATIFAAVFVTLLIVNYPAGPDHGISPFEQKLGAQIQSTLNVAIYQGLIPSDENGPIQAEVDAFTQKLVSEAGLDLPMLPRYLLWTAKALTFNWGNLESAYFPSLGLSQGLRSQPTADAVLDYLPNTLLLVGTAYLLTFLLGMPLALYLARNYGSRLDRIFSVLSPVSSVPSWVFAALLVVVFAVQLRWLPIGGMFDFHKPEEPIPYVWALIRHMVLPVSALLLSLLFQLVYTWRTFFVIYSEEDYVELARAKGLETKTLENQYILRPALPYIITSFATSLIGFWQLTVALEKIFQWPGIGLLYLDVLPNYWEDSMQVGDLMIVVQIVVTFSYLLGLLAFILDLVYVLVDPRIHLVPASSTAQTNAPAKTKRRRWHGFFARSKEKFSARVQPVPAPAVKPEFSWDIWIPNAGASIHEIRDRGRLFIEQLRMYPSAIFGLTIIAMLIAGSIYALVFLPYEEIGRNYTQDRLQGRNLLPRMAAPIWLNHLSTRPRLSTLLMEEDSPQANVKTQTLENGWVEKTVTFQFEYAYSEIPTDVFLYLEAEYVEKIPFSSMQWTTPDGRIIDLKSRAISGQATYDLEDGMPVAKLLSANPEWKSWFVTNGQHPTPAFTLLFAKPDVAQPVPQHGTYQLSITSLLFEEGSNVKPQMVLLGQVYGLAGTDYWRRDLVVPLFWGMPFTLIVGFLGTFITALIAMLLPAIGVWFGGTLDNIIQRLTEVNMVLPGLAIAVLLNAIFGTHIWIVLGIVVVLNAFGAPIKSFRSAFLQAKEAPYIEMARSYGASDFRIITRYLIPRILPVLIPTLVAQIPSFIFLEATLGFFNIKTIYPSWGRIIYDGLANGALYGSPFWVLEPIFLLLLTGLAFAMLGLALERILNPRVISDVPVTSSSAGTAKRDQRPMATPGRGKRLFVGLMLALVAIVIFIPTGQGKTLASLFMNYLDPRQIVDTRITSSSAGPTKTPGPTASLTSASSTPTELQSTPTALSSATAPSTATPVVETQTTLAPFSTALSPGTYTLQRGEYPYCIARRFNVDPDELLALNGLSNRQTFYAGTELEIPQTGKPYPGERVQKVHPTTYTVSASNETLYTIACQFGDLDPLAIAQANNLPLDSVLYTGQQLTIP